MLAVAFTTFAWAYRRAAEYAEQTQRVLISKKKMPQTRGFLKSY